MVSWEISNPSDHYTMLAPSFEVAVLACLMLGHGHYGLDAGPGNASEDSLPIFLFGGFDEWWAGHSPEESLPDALTRLEAEVAKALGTVLIGDRAEFEASGLSWGDWHDRKRTSMNNIGQRARTMSEKMLERLEAVADG